MAAEIELQNIPNQNFQLLVEEDSYDITLKTIGDITYVSITRNSEVIITSTRAKPNQNILENVYQFNEHGNFVFVSGDDEYPFFENFGVLAIFNYLTKAEVASGA